MYILRKMKTGDLVFLMEMVTTAGWNQIETDWIRYIELEPDGCFVAEVNGEPVGTATTVCYENKIGWIGMVIVKPSQKGKGIGKALLENSIEYLRSKVETIKLDATPMGEPLYTKLGFKPEYTVARLATKTKSTQQTGNHLLDISLAEIIELDKNVFGANREHVLTRLISEYPEYAAVEKNEHRLVGFVLANRGQHHWHIGPLISKDEKTAAVLLEKIFAKLSGKKVFVDVPVFAGKRKEMFSTFGFTPVRFYTRMYLGPNQNSGKIEHVFATARAEKG